MTDGTGDFYDIDPELLGLFDEDHFGKLSELEFSGPRDNQSDFDALGMPDLMKISREKGPDRNNAVLEIARRASYDDSAARLARDLALLSDLREDRLFHWSSMSWAVLHALLSADTPVSRSCAYEVFYAFYSAEQSDVLFWLKAPSIEEASVPSGPGVD
ncbi:hypothetical protein ACFV4K_28000 [Nocardia sp. NPDC059764]|uniref:hypothetical protein n=1 Tax=Nocardia sp. NPDC059764 TaxID=3346939 RepID=UPI00365BECA7